MLKQVCVVIAIAWLLSTAVWGQDSRYGSGDVHVSLNDGDNVVYIGETNTVEFWIENDATLGGMGIGFEFTIIADYFFDPIHGGAGHYVKEHGRAIGAFDMLTGLLENTTMDDLSPDTIYYGGSTMPGYGLPAGPLELCYTMEFDILPGQGEVAGGFSIDNIVLIAGGNWTFVDASGSYPPDYQGNPNSSEGNPDAPAVAFDIVERTNTPPEITNCPSVPSSVSHGEVFYYQFVAYDPDPGDELTWMIVDGPGTITTDGHYDFDPDYPDMYTVVIRVEDQALDFDECAFELIVTNTAPVITNCPVEVVINHCNLFAHHFEASDLDPGDVLTWEELAGYGTINSVTGDYVFDPFMYGLGSFTIEVKVSDAFEAYEICVFNLHVINTSPEVMNSCLDTVAVVPLSIVEYTFEAVDPDPCDVLTYGVESVVPTPMGEYYMIGETFFFEPLDDDAGTTFEFTGFVTDGWDQITFPVWVEVLAGNDCVVPIDIDSLPFTYSASTSDYTDMLQPDPNACGVSDPEFGIGPDVVFSYTAEQSESLFVWLAPMSEWDAALYLLKPCDADSCVLGANDGEMSESEWISAWVEVGETIYIVVDAVAGAEGDFFVSLSNSTAVFCKKFEKRIGDMKVESCDKKKSGGGKRGKSVVQSLLGKPSKCQLGYEVHARNSKTAIVYAGIKLAAKKRFGDRKGEAQYVLKFSTWYKVIPDIEEQDKSETIECTLREFEFKVIQSRLTNPEYVRTPGESYFHYKRGIEPFVSDETWYAFKDGSKDGWMPWKVGDSDDDGVATGSVNKDFTHDPATLSFNTQYDINLEFKVRAEANKKQIGADSRLMKFNYQVQCPQKPGEEKNCEDCGYPVVFGESKLEIVRLLIDSDSTITLPSEFAWRYIQVDSSFTDGGIAYSHLPDFGSVLYYAQRINDFADVDSITYDIDFPPDTSALFTLVENTVDTFSTTELLPAPSDITFDVYGHFGNRLLVAQCDSFVGAGIPSTGSGVIAAIDEYGNVEAIAENLDSPTGLVVTSGSPFGDMLYVTEIDTGAIVAVDPAGTHSTFASGLRCPGDLTVGSGDFGDYLYVVEYDTVTTDSVSHPNSGKILKVDASGTYTTFADALQGPTDLKFGPGGIFGTDLYVCLDNEYGDTTFFVPNSGKIVTINAAGDVADFCTGLHHPEYLSFDNSGVLYVGVVDGIIRIAAYICGDANADGTVNITDAVYLINYIFAGGPEPVPYAAGDVNCDGTVNITDAVYLINYIFGGGPPPGDPDDDGVPDC